MDNKPMDTAGEKTGVTGRIHSFQSLGAVDGPGLRAVVFMQGCPLRCAYCHNPDTWPADGGQETTPRALFDKILRYRPYFGKTGGVTVSGGEPLLQGRFVAELFRLLRGAGVHTALDTSGIGDPAIAHTILAHTSLVLCDLKFTTEEDYARYSGGSLRAVLAFLQLTEELRVPLWIRHVVVPGLTDGEAHIRALAGLVRRFTNLEKLELLPFQTLCQSKYDALGIPFPLKGVPPCPEQTIRALYGVLRDEQIPLGAH